MAITHIHSYLVRPGKKAGHVSKVIGTTVPLTGDLFGLLNDIYERSDAQCDIEISFNPRDDGQQQNPCRDIFLHYLSGPHIAKGKQIAERLEGVTTKRSGLGLLFLIAGKEKRNHKLIISRFPTDNAILAEENQQQLNVTFLERVFMKSATSYKAALYEGQSLTGDFWSGKAIDRQINDRVIQVSNYWIADFLDSDFLLTAAQGTKRFALAMKEASRRTKDLKIKNEIAAAATLAKSLVGKRASIKDFEVMLNLSEATIKAINAHVPEGLEDKFKFDLREFQEHLAYRSIELDNGGILTAETGEFDKIFHRRPTLDQGITKVHFSTEGKIVSERIGKSTVYRVATGK